jgi:tripartite-type tricarboxylate transporter receptor subunit TctC
MQNTGINRRSVLRSFLALIGGVLAPIDARAAVYPSRPIKIIVPFGPGGSGDIE